MDNILSQEQRKQFSEEYEAMRQLPPDERAKILSDRRAQLSEEQQRLFSQEYEAMRQLPPDERAKIHSERIEQARREVERVNGPAQREQQRQQEQQLRQESIPREEREKIHSERIEQARREVERVNGPAQREQQRQQEQQLRQESIPREEREKIHSERIEQARREIERVNGPAQREQRRQREAELAREREQRRAEREQRRAELQRQEQYEIERIAELTRELAVVQLRLVQDRQQYEIEQLVRRVGPRAFELLANDPPAANNVGEVDPMHVHKVFRDFLKKKVEYLKIINPANKALLYNTREIDLILHIKEKFIEYINRINEFEDKNKIKSDVDAVFNQIINYLDVFTYDSSILEQSITFAFSQNDDFISEYIKYIINESINGYNNKLDNISCSLGIIERFSLAVPIAAKIMCTGTDNCDKKYKDLEILFNFPNAEEIFTIAADWVKENPMINNETSAEKRQQLYSHIMKYYKYHPVDDINAQTNNEYIQLIKTKILELEDEIFIHSDEYNKKVKAGRKSKKCRKIKKRKIKTLKRINNVRFKRAKSHRIKSKRAKSHRIKRCYANGKHC